MRQQLLPADGTVDALCAGGTITVLATLSVLSIQVFDDLAAHTEGRPPNGPRGRPGAKATVQRMRVARRHGVGTVD
jgi:hypothetical protein